MGGPRGRDVFKRGTSRESAQARELLERLVVAVEARNRSGEAYERDARIVRELVAECSRAGVGLSRIARLTGISQQRVNQLRSRAPEAQARKAERAAIFNGGDVLVE